MRSILVLNPKGGCGKSTLATNIAAYFSMTGMKVALADCDPQQSGRDWLAARPASAAAISPAGLKDGKLQVQRGTELVVVDSPAATHGKRLAAFIQACQTLVIPVVPSPIDIRAAEHFLRELYLLRGLINRKIKLATVANRVREDTLAAARLENYLDKIRLPDGHKLPYITVLRASQNYLRAAENGLSIFEFAPAKTLYDREQWQPLLRWLSSERSLPG
jgi:chromosome partitioning protein